MMMKSPLFVVFVVLLVARLFGAIDWAWYWVASPMVLWFVMVLILQAAAKRQRNSLGYLLSQMVNRNVRW